MTDSEELKSNQNLFDRLKQKLREQQQEKKLVLDELAGSIFDIYRAFLGDEFTVDKAINVARYGYEIKPEQWAALSDNVRDRLDVFQTRSPLTVDKTDLGQKITECIGEYLTCKKNALTDSQAALFPEMLTQVLVALEANGVKFGNKNRQVYVPGLVQLVDYKNWLVSHGQHFMNFDDYGFEVTLTDTAINAHGKVLLEMLKIAGTVRVNYGLGQNKIEGITEVSIERGWPREGEGELVVKYKTKAGTAGRINVLYDGITVPEAEERQRRYYRPSESNRFL